MAEPGKYLIGESLREKLKSTIAKVDSIPFGGPVSRIPTVIESDGPAVTPKPTRIAAYPRDKFWKKGEVSEITFYTHNGTEYGLATMDASGTATAVNVCNDLPPVPTGIDDPRLGPTPTMTWCVISESRGGAKVVIEGQQAGTFMAAFPTDQGEWGTGQTRTVEQYFYADGEYQSTGFTAPAINVGPSYKPLAATETSGPTPTMAWCIVATAPDGGLVAVEAENAPETQWATIEPAAIGDPWQRTSTRTVTLPGSDESVDVVSAFDYYSPLDFPHGLVFTKGVSPNGDGTANVVIGPSPVPIHSARYDEEAEWPHDETRQLTVLPSAGITQQRSVVVSNPYYDSIEASDKPLAIGKVGTAYHVITAPPQSGVKLGARLEFGDKDTPWDRTSERYVQITGTTSEVQVVSAFDHYTHLDVPFGLAYTKARDPRGGDGTANVVIGPPPIPIHSASPQEEGSWARGEDKVLDVLPSQGITQTRVANVSNPYFDDIEIDPNKPMAIGKVGTAYHVITAPAQAGVKLGTRVIDTYLEEWDSPWPRNASRVVQITGTTTTVQVVNTFDHYSHLDVPHGLAFVKSRDESGSTANVLISPPPAPLHSVTTTENGTWVKGQDKILAAPPASTEGEPRPVNVSNPYFDEVRLDPNTPMAIGKFGTSYHVITAPSPEGLRLGTREVDSYLEDWDSPWPRNASRPVRITGSTSVVQVLNAFEHYSHLDVPNGLAFMQTKVAGGSTANVLIAPPPTPLHSARTTESGTWAKDQQKLLAVPPSEPGGDERAVNVTNPYFDEVRLDPNTPMAIGKFGTAFHLIAAPGSPGVTFADRTDNDQWERGSQRTVKLFGGTVTESAYNLAGHYESFDGRGTGGMPGLVLGKGPDLSGGSGTAYYVIAPPPITIKSGTCSGAWPIGTGKDITIRGVTSTPNSVNVTNKLVSLPAPSSTATTRIVNIAKDGNQWYLVSFQMSAKTAVMATVTQTITFIGTAATQALTFISSANTQTLTYASAGADLTLTYVPSASDVEVIAGVSATLDTANCSISVTTTKTTIKAASNPVTKTFKTGGGTQTATIVSLGSTQTAAIMSISGTQTAVITTGTYTATFISLEI